MSKRMKDNLAYLQILAKCKPAHGPADVLMCVCECCYNLLKGTVPLTPTQKRRLSRYKKHHRALADKKVSRVKKRRILNQKGGNLLAALLPPVLSVLGSLFIKGSMPKE